jgi:DNA end-binding protein Ku
MAPRPNWKGYLKLSLVACPIALYPATSSSERVSFNQINKQTGNRIRYRKVDEESGEEVEQADIIKGYQVEKGVYVHVDDDELEALQVESNHTIEIDKFVPLKSIDERFFDSPYYIVPNDEVGQDAFAVIREAMRNKEMVGLGRVVLAKRERPIILRPLGKGLEGMTLRYPYEVRKFDDYFNDITEIKIPPEMLKLAEHIIETKEDDFKPEEFVDHYEAAVVDLLKKKRAGVPVKSGPSRAPSSKVINLMDALRKSAATDGKTRKSKSPSIQPSLKKGKTKVRARA